MSAWHTTDGRTWYARLGALGVHIEPAARGYRADLYGWARGPERGHVGRIGLYPDLEAAKDRAIADALRLLADAGPCSCSYVTPCSMHAGAEGAR